MEKNIEDSCMFIRQIILTLYKFPEAQATSFKEIANFYEGYKFSLTKLIIENLKVSKLCDESKITINKINIITFFFNFYI